MDIIKKTLCAWVLLLTIVSAYGIDLNFKLSLKQPGNDAVTYALTSKGNNLTASEELPLTVYRKSIPEGKDVRLIVSSTAKERVYFNIGISVPTDYQTDDCEFYLPGFWYHKNLRSPREAPSFHTSKSWNFREDRLSSPLTGVYDSRSGRTLIVLRNLEE